MKWNKVPIKELETTHLVSIQKFLLKQLTIDKTLNSEYGGHTVLNVMIALTDEILKRAKRVKKEREEIHEVHKTDCANRFLHPYFALELAG